MRHDFFPRTRTLVAVSALACLLLPVPAQKGDATTKPAQEKKAKQETKPTIVKPKRPARLPRALSTAIKKGLMWLDRHQDESGRWRASGFDHFCPSGDECEGPGNALNDIGATGLALLAFLGGGSNLREGQNKDVVRAAVTWLEKQADKSGTIGTRAGHSFMYNHAIATHAIVEAYRLSKYRIVTPHAQQAIDFICKARNPRKVWRYSPRDGENDSSVTGWMVLALTSAQAADLDVDPAAFNGAQAWFHEVTDQKSGRVGYTRRGERSSRSLNAAGKFPVEKTEALTALGLLCRLRMGQDPLKQPVLRSAADTIVKRLPAWTPKEGNVDLYYWFYGTRALHALGGDDYGLWDEKLVEALSQSQETDGHATGSWDPVGPWGTDGGRVYSTALAVLCLETTAGLYKPLR